MFHPTRTEKFLYLVSFTVLALVVIHLAWAFYNENSIVIPATGGTYTEGTVGNVNFINPLLAHSNTVEADLVKLVYSGLTRYDPATGDIAPDLATYTLDTSKKKYTFQINPAARWHDGTPVTADDVVFTYQDIIQSPEFDDPVLKGAFQDVKIEKIDTLTVQFTLKEPYYFFPTATTLGILPKHLWEDIPVRNIDKSEYNLAPVGSGPYKFAKINFPSANANQPVVVDLQAFADYYGTPPKINAVSFKIFDTKEALVKGRAGLDAVNNVDRTVLDLFKEDSRFQVFSYSLPQYVALFMNTATPKLEEKNVRLALLLATNKDDILKQLAYVQRVDTPFLELKNNTWIYQFDEEKAKGALFDAGWKLKASAALRSAYYASINLLAANYGITEPNNGASFTTSQNYFVLRGTSPTTAQGILINGYQLQKFTPSKGSWSYIISAELGTLKKGANTYTVQYIDENNQKILLDSITITYAPSTPAPQPTSNANANRTTVANKNTNISAVSGNSNSSSPENSNTNNTIVNGNNNTNAALMNGNQNGTNANLNQNNAPARPPIPAEILQQLRYNSAGEPLVLCLVTSENPTEFSRIAEYLRQTWLKIGIYTDIEVLPNNELLHRIEQKDYDILLYGQSLEYNLDTFPYWHSSQAGSGLNLSNFKNFPADSLIEEIRNPYLDKSVDVNNRAQVETARQEDLQKLVKIFEDNIPAIFLYQPIYYYAADQNKIQNLEISNLSTFEDRLTLLSNWYINEQRVLKEPFSWQGFGSWLWQGLQWR